MKPKTSAADPRRRPTAAQADNHWSFRLYVAGQTPRSLTALINLRRLCETHLAGRHEIEVVDLIKSPELGQTDQVVALPTLVRKHPQPAKRLIGDLSNTQRVLVGIDLFPTASLA